MHIVLRVLQNDNICQFYMETSSAEEKEATLAQLRTAHVVIALTVTWHKNNMESNNMQCDQLKWNVFYLECTFSSRLANKTLHCLPAIE
jgi:hypothetical protein